MIQIISGTNRPGSNTLKLSHQILSLYQELGVPAAILDLGTLPKDLFDPSAYAEKPASFTPFSDAVLNAEGLVIVSPEYNGSMPGVLKYFIDMLKFPESFENKPVCFVGLAAGMWGSLRSVEQLQLIFGYRNAYLFPERVFISGVFNQLDEAGKLKDPALLERLKNQAQGFSHFTKKMKGLS
jgi:chromate reductase, NAD(P)H dehydrogenase (quinone)